MPRLWDTVCSKTMLHDAGVGCCMMHRTSRSLCEHLNKSSRDLKAGTPFQHPQEAEGSTAILGN